jgi:hypothetical protein
MRKFILSSLELISTLAIFLILVSGIINGATNAGIAGGSKAAIFGGAIGFVVALIACVILFGVVFLLLDIADNTRRTAEAIEKMRAVANDGN